VSGRREERRGARGKRRKEKGRGGEGKRRDGEGARETWKVMLGMCLSRSCTRLTGRALKKRDWLRLKSLMIEPIDASCCMFTYPLSQLPSLW